MCSTPDFHQLRHSGEGRRAVARPARELHGGGRRGAGAPRPAVVASARVAEAVWREWFGDLPLSPAMQANLQQLGYLAMTPIQAASLPIALAGGDLIAQAKTGSGKTAAFALALLTALNPRHFAVQALVLCPTRELADQVTTEIRRLATATQPERWELVDRLRLNREVLAGEHGMAEQPVFGSLVWAAPAPLQPPELERLLEQARSARKGLEGSMACGALEQGMVARYRGPSSQAARFWFCRIWALIRAQRGQAPPELPRVWPFQEQPLLQCST